MHEGSRSHMGRNPRAAMQNASNGIMLIKGEPPRM